MVFGILQRPLRCSYQNSLCIIDSIFRLHNFRLEVFNKERKTIEERMSILKKRIEYKFKEYILKNYNELDQDQVNSQSNDPKRDEIAKMMWNTHCQNHQTTS